MYHKSLNQGAGWLSRRFSWILDLESTVILLFVGGVDNF